MIVRFDHHIIMGNQHFLSAHDGADGGAFGQIDIFNGTANHLGRFGVAVGNGFNGFGGAAPQGVDVHHVATAYVAEQAADGGLLGRNGDIDVVPLHQIHIGRVGDQGHDFACAQPLGQQRSHDVGLVVVGQGAEYIGVFDVGLEQFVAVGGEALQYHGLVQFFSKPLGAFRIAFQDFDVVASLDGLGQAVADVAAAGDDHALVVVLKTTQFAHDGADVVLGCNKEHFVIGFDNGVAFRNDGAPATEDGRHTGVHIGHVFAQLAQLVADQWAAVISAHRHQLYPAAGKVHHLQGARVLNQATNIIGDYLLGADDHIDGQGVFVEQLFRPAGVVGGADTGNLGGGAEQGVGHLTGDHVHLVRVGYGDQHVGVFGAGLFQYRRVAAHAAHGADVEPVAELTQTLRIGVDDGDVVALVGQVFRQGAPHLTGTENNDLHVSC